MEQKTISAADFLKDNLYVLRETFEGSPAGQPSAYLDRGNGIFSTLEKIGYTGASESVNGNTIAAHTEHLKFYIDRLVEYMAGRAEEINWEQSWLIETVNESEWDILRAGVRKSYDQLLVRVSETEEWDQTSIGGLIAIIAHTAYHLGAIRQIKKAFDQERDVAAN